jgi:hypothetical protein
MSTPRAAREVGGGVRVARSPKVRMSLAGTSSTQKKSRPFKHVSAELLLAPLRPVTKTNTIDFAGPGPRG